jgi:hypothetical protein
VSSLYRWHLVTALSQHHRRRSIVSASLGRIAAPSLSSQYRRSIVVVSSQRRLPPIVSKIPTGLL